MKALITYFVFIITFKASAALLGGVGVGNGMVVAGLNYKNDFKSKEEALKELKKLSLKIKNGEVPAIKKYIAEGGCDPNYSELNNAELLKFYKIVNKKVSKQKEIVMHLQINLKNCKNYRAIRDELPYDQSK